MYKVSIDRISLGVSLAYVPRLWGQSGCSGNRTKDLGGESSQGRQAMNSLRAKRQYSGLWKDILLFPVGRKWLTWITLRCAVSEGTQSKLLLAVPHPVLPIYLVVRPRQPTYQKLLIVAACSKISKQSFSTKRIQSCIMWPSGQPNICVLEQSFSTIPQRALALVPGQLVHGLIAKGVFRNRIIEPNRTW